LAELQVRAKRLSRQPRTTHPRARLVAGVAVIAALLVAAFLLPTPFDPSATNAFGGLQAPDATHWFGTDSVGADVFSRTLRAGRTDLPLVIGGTGLALLLGVPFGLLLSTRSPWSERAMRVLDGIQSLPLLILILAMVALSQNDPRMIIAAIAIYAAPVYIRLLRSQVLTLREARFIEAARAIGAHPLRIMFRHLLPNLWVVILAQTSLTLAASTLALASLSFLGVGVKPPTPSWGGMIRDGASYLLSGDWWLVVFPGAAVVIAVLTFNVLADALYEIERSSSSG
jgi:peptide/nickel transport system permease protein